MVRPAPFRLRLWWMAALVVSIALGTGEAAAQCRVLSAPRGFDPPPGVTPPVNFATRAGSMTISASTSPKRLAVRWNYGFAVYSLATPAVPAFQYFQNLRDSGYPKNGDGSDRTGNVGMSDDGQRFIVPWTDPAGFGTIAMSATATGYSAAGDYLPNVGLGQDSKVEVLKVGSRYLGFTLAGGTLYVADLTNLPSSGASTPGNIPSEATPGISVLNGMVLDLVAFQGGGKSWILVNGYNKIFVVDVSSPGPSVPGLSSGFVVRTLGLADFTPTGAAAWGSFKSLAGAVHPVEGVPYIMAEGTGTPSPGVTLVKLDPSSGAVTRIGSYIPQAPYNYQTAATVLLPYDTEVLGLFLTKSSTDATKLNALASSDFTRDLAPDATLGVVSGTAILRALRGSSTALSIYSGSQTGAWAAGLDCVLSNAPATPSLTVEKLVGSTVVPLSSGDPVFLGDAIRITPRVSPPPTTQALTDWRFDYDFHSLSLLEASTTYPRVKQPDLCLSCPGGTTTPPASLDLVGPCDPRNTDPAAPNLLTGVGCWTSVTTNDLEGGPDFAVDAASPAQKTLTFALEAQNALNGVNGAPTSGLSTFNLLWKVPKPAVKVSTILYGDAVQDGSEGSPDTSSTAWEWYFASVAGATTLVRDAACTGPTCAHAFPGKGTFGYFLRAPYRGGYRTPDCAKDMDGNCTNALGTLVVSDVSLVLTAPTSVYRTNPVISIASQSRKGAGVTGTFSYELCTSSDNPCLTTSATGAATPVGDPFAVPSGGAVTIPMPANPGAYYLRIGYTYTGTADCTVSAPCKVFWPTQSTWAPVLVSNALPEIRLTSPTGADICFNGICALYVGDTGRAYSYVNGVLDPAPPATMRWTWGNGGSSVTGPSAQGASFVYSGANTYTITLEGYGAPFTKEIYVTDKPVAQTPPSVYAFNWTPTNPAVGATAAFTCSATAGSNPISSYRFLWGDGTNTTGSSATATHSWTAAGTKYVSCTVTDTGGLTSSRSASVTVGVTTGTCDFQIKDQNGARISYDPVTGSYDAAAGQLLRFEAVGATGTVNWNFGDGTTGTGNPVNHAYATTSPANGYTAVLTATGCSRSYTIFISGALFDFNVTDVATGASLAKTGTTFEAKAAQQLRFTATGASGAMTWNFGDGTTSAEATPVKAYSPLVNTTYTVTLTNGTNVKTYSVKVEGSTGAPLTGNYGYRYVDGSTVNRLAVEPNKPIRFTGLDQATTFTWDFGDGSALATGSPKDYSFNRAGTFSVKLTVARDGLPGTVSTAAPTSFVVKAPPDPLLWVAGGMAYTDNGAGVKWQSDLSIHNPGTQTATLSLGYVAGDGWDGYKNVVWVPQALVPGETKSYTNVLKSFFRLDQGAWGVVLVRGDDIAVPPVIVSRTYNAALSDTAGTFGLSVPAMYVGAGVKPQSASGENVMAGLRHDASFRTNLTVANLKDETTEVEVVFRDPSGNVLGVPARVTVEPRGVKQLNAALSAAPAAAGAASGGAGWTEPVSNFSAEVTLKKGSGVYPYATVIDQVTGDSIVVTPAARPSPTSRLPGVVRVKGKSGSYWMSDVAVLNPSAKPRRVTVTYSYEKLGLTGRFSRTETMDFKPWEMKVAVDFVKIWLGLEEDDPGGYASAFLDVTPAADDAAPTENLIVAGKTYTPSGLGSVGLQVDPFSYDDGINVGSSRKRIVLSGLEANLQYRTNLALFMTPGSTGTAQVDVKVLDSFGRVAKAFWGVGLNADTPIVQLNSSDLFPGLSTDDVSRATIVVDNPRGSAVVGAYATVIDNKSDDATFVAGQPAP